ncbi:MAG: hypothetical protein ACREQ9_17815 [Candidatus Binatia bacterium]
MSRSVLPRWFRFATAASFGVLVLSALLLHDGTVRATAQGLFERLAAPAGPILGAQAMLGESRGLPGKGTYRLNGMRVRFDTFGAPNGAGRVLIQIEEMLERAGYVHRIVPVRGIPMTVGIHPKTRVMITAMPGRDLKGNPVVRLTQQNLGDLTESFRPEIPGIAVYPGAKNQTLIESLEGPSSTSLSYAAGGIPADVGAYYVAEMRRLGWNRIAAPAGADGSGLEVLFFQREGAECSVLISRIPGGAESYVLASVTGGLPEA